MLPKSIAENRLPPGQRTGGFGLIEVLIAVLVLALGVLGFMKLQTLGVKSATSASLRLEAVHLSTDMLERVRANRRAALNGSYDVEFGSDPATGLPSDDEIKAWRDALARNLPEGQGAITSNGRQVTITARWAEQWDDDADSGTAVVRLRTEP